MLHSEVCRFANVLRKMGVKKGDRVSIYLPIVITSYSIHYTKLYEPDRPGPSAFDIQD